MLDDLNKTIGANKTNILSLLSIWEHRDFRRAVNVFDIRDILFYESELGKYQVSEQDVGTPHYLYRVRRNTVKLGGPGTPEKQMTNA